MFSCVPAASSTPGAPALGTSSSTTGGTAPAFSFAMGPALAATATAPAPAIGPLASAPATALASVSLPVGGSVLFRPPTADGKAAPAPATTSAGLPAAIKPVANVPTAMAPPFGTAASPRAPTQLRRSATTAAAPAAPAHPPVPTPLSTGLRTSLLAGGGKDILASAEPLLQVVAHLETRAHTCQQTLSRLSKPPVGGEAAGPAKGVAAAAAAAAAAADVEARASKAQATLRGVRTRVDGLEGALQQLERTHAAVLHPAVSLLREARPTEAQPDPEVIRRLCMMPLLPEEMVRQPHPSSRTHLARISRLLTPSHAFSRLLTPSHTPSRPGEAQQPYPSSRA